MKKLKNIVFISAVAVFLICLYAFLAGNGVFKGKFENESFAWYFLAKGIFCSLMLYIGYRVVESLKEK